MPLAPYRSTTAYERDVATGQVQFDTYGNPEIVYNPANKTYLDMQTRVLYECLGPATSDDVKQAIQDAIGTFERETFYFNEIRYFASPGTLSQLSTVLGKEFYSQQDLYILSNMPHIRQIMVLAFGNRYPLRQRTQQWIDDQSISTNWRGLPTDWCWVDGGLRIYPIPMDAYPLIVEGTVRFPPLYYDADTNPWVNEAESLIRCEAKRLIFTNINRDAGQATEMKREIYGEPEIGRQGHLAILRRESMRRAGGTGRLRPSKGYL